MTGGDERYRTLTEQRIHHQEAQIETLVQSVEQIRLSRSLTTTDDEHDPEGSMVSLDQARDAALLVRAREALVELVAARERLRDGSYGRCERCQRQIPAARLDVRPEARRCVSCAAVER